MIFADLNFDKKCGGGCQGCDLGRGVQDTADGSKDTLNLLRKTTELPEFFGANIRLGVGGLEDQKNIGKIIDLVNEGRVKDLYFNVRKADTQEMESIKQLTGKIGNDIFVVLCIEQSRKEQEIEESLGFLPATIQCARQIMQNKKKVGVSVGVNDARPDVESERIQKLYEQIHRQVQNITSDNLVATSGVFSPDRVKHMNGLRFTGHTKDEENRELTQAFTDSNIPGSEFLFSTSIRELRGRGATISETIEKIESGKSDERYLGYFGLDEVNPFHTIYHPKTKLSPFWIEPIKMSEMIERAKIVGYQQAKLEYLKGLLV